jgi:hypothetical protein
MIDVSGGLHHSNCPYAISNISLRWMIRELVAAGYHDLFENDASVQELFPRITIPEPSLLVEQTADPLDIDDLKQTKEK